MTLPLFWGASILPVAAQTDGPTPRQTFTSFVTNTPLSELKFKPISPLGETAPAITEPDLPALSSAQDIATDPITGTVKSPVADIPVVDVSVADTSGADIQVQTNEIEPPLPEAISRETADDKTASLSPNNDSEPAKPLPDTGKANAQDTESPLEIGAKSPETPEPSTPAAEILTDTLNTAANTAANVIPEIFNKSPAPEDSASAEPETISEPEPELAGASKDSNPAGGIALLPFYTSAPDYLAARGSSKQTQLELKYKVSLTGAKSSLTSSVETRTITIGPDFVASESGGQTRIFDFRTNRLLTLTAQGPDIIFSNISLYPGALKNVQTVNKATKNGELSEIELGPDRTLDAFWLEGNLGWAARAKFEPLKVSREDNQVSSSFGELTPFTASLTGPKMPSEDHMRALFTWWHHDLPIHPSVLVRMGRPDNAPQTLNILSLSPKFPNGLMAKWDLMGSKQSTASFPLPETAKTSIEARQSSPLAFAIAQAVRGEALSKRPSLDDLRQEIEDSQSAGRGFEAWLAAQTLADRIGGCAKDAASLCKEIAALEAKAAAGSDLAKLPKIIRKARRPGTRLEGFTELAPYVDGKIAPAFLVKIAGQARARIKTNTLTDPKLKALRADKLLEEALVKNPYDPVIYRTLGQVYAAQGRLTESWDMQDAMRQLSDVPTSLSDPINWAERSLLVRAPGFFLQDIP